MSLLSFATAAVRPHARRVRWSALVIGALAAGCATVPPPPPAAPPARVALPAPAAAPTAVAPPAPVIPASPATSRTTDVVPAPAPPVATPTPPIPSPTAVLPAPGPAAAPAPTAAPRPSLHAVAPGTLYVCFTEANGQSHETPIEFGPKVGALCRRHPEMGPCQYEREMCRQSGGRVFTASGTEITPATEAEYDKRVLRVRFRAN